jgi:hypothetical protein
MHVISRDSPCFYLTTVTKDRLRVFRTDEINLLTCAALNEARQSGRFAYYAYVLMPIIFISSPIRTWGLRRRCSSSTESLVVGLLIT